MMFCEWTVTQQYCSSWTTITAVIGPRCWWLGLLETKHWNVFTSYKRTANTHHRLTYIIHLSAEVCGDTQGVLNLCSISPSHDFSHEIKKLTSVIWPIFNNNRLRHINHSCTLQTGAKYSHFWNDDWQAWLLQVYNAECDRNMMHWVRKESRIDDDETYVLDD